MRESNRDLLRKHGITPTATRMRVWQYLEHNTSHPTADQIFRALADGEVPISRATVYNTVRCFVEHGLLDELRGSDEIVHYDPLVEPHAHFQCRSCGKLWNLPSHFEPEKIKELEGFTIDNTEIIIHGTCPDCKQKAKGEIDKNA